MQGFGININNQIEHLQLKVYTHELLRKLDPSPTWSIELVLKHVLQ